MNFPKIGQKKRNKEIKVEKRKKEIFPRFFFICKAVFLLLIVICFLLLSYQTSQALDPIEEGVGISVTIEGTAPPPPGGGGGPIFATVVFKGKASPDAFITILRNNSVASTTTADSSANFSATLTGVPIGIWTFSIWAEDKEGKESLTLSFKTSLTSGTTTFAGIFLAPTINLNSTEITKGEFLDIYGYTAPESEVSVYIDSRGEIIETIKAENDGKWFYSLDITSLEKGFSYSVKAKAISPEGLISSFSEVLEFYLELEEEEILCPRADLNRDGRTDMIDFSILLYWWQKYDACADQNQDGIVNLIDFSIMMYHWTG